jgi:hypothetical protein
VDAKRHGSGTEGRSDPTGRERLYAVVSKEAEGDYRDRLAAELEISASDQRRG